MSDGNAALPTKSRHKNSWAAPDLAGDNTNPLPEESISRFFWRRCCESGEKIALSRKYDGVARTISWAEYGKNAKFVGLGFVALGVYYQDVVSILSEGRPEWLYADFGAQGVGAIPNGIYTTSSRSQISHILQDSKTKICVVENERQLELVVAICETVPSLKKIVVIDSGERHDDDDELIITFNALIALGERFEQQDPTYWDRALARAKLEDTAILVYTSGTTGPPKGVLLSNKNLLALLAVQPMIMPQHSNDTVLSYLPLCHTAGRSIAAIFPIQTGCKVVFVEASEKLMAELVELQPTVFFAPPRHWVKQRSRVIGLIKNSDSFTKFAYRWAEKIARCVNYYQVNNLRKPLLLSFAYLFADWMVFSKIKFEMGMSRCTSPLTGAAPLPEEVVDWYFGLGIELREGYGQTECAGVISAIPQGSFKTGTVGRILPNTEVVIAENGEILVSGPQVFKGYFNQPYKTREALVNGWLKTGDVGYIDTDGWLHVTDRLKDIIITEGGKNIAPTEIENKLKSSPYISDAVVVGDGRNYLTCLIALNLDNVLLFAYEQKLDVKDIKALYDTAEIKKLIAGEVENANRQLARPETIKKFRIIDQALTIEGEDLTASGKIRRKAVSNKYKVLVEEMYGEQTPI